MFWSKFLATAAQGKVNQVDRANLHCNSRDAKHQAQEVQADEQTIPSRPLTEIMEPRIVAVCVTLL